MRLQNASSIFSGLFPVLLFLINLIPTPAEATQTESPVYRLRVHYTTQNIQGTWVDNLVSLETTLDTGTIVALNLQLRYDDEALLLTDIIPSDTERVQWEYFQSDFWKRDDSNNTAAPGIIRIKARGRLRWAYPEDFLDSARPFPLFVIRTLITNDRTLECYLARVDWYWDSCENNVLQIDNDETHLTSRLVLDSIKRCEIQDSTVGYPTRLGAQQDCKFSDGGRTERLIEFVNGGPELMCFGGFDASGDLNLNGIGFDSADYALYNHMLLHGIDSIDSYNPAGTIAASEINGDGKPLTVSDLVFMKRIEVGDALPCRQASKPDTAFLVLNDEYLSLSTRDTIGGLYLKLAGQFEPELLRTDVTLSCSIEDNTTRILILGREPDTTAKLTSGQLLRFLPSEERASLKRVKETQTSTVYGCPVEALCLEAARIERVSGADFDADTGLIDTPFSPTTNIEFVIWKANYAELRIYNASGRMVRLFPLGLLSSGKYSIAWDARDYSGASVTSGVYFYQLITGGLVETKKLVLLK